MFLLDFLYCCTLPDCIFPRELCSCYTDKLSGGIRKKFGSLNLAHNSVIRSDSFNESCFRELAHSHSQRALEFGRVFSHRLPLELLRLNKVVMRVLYFRWQECKPSCSKRRLILTLVRYTEIEFPTA